MKTRLILLPVIALAGTSLFALGRQSDAVMHASSHALNIELAEKQIQITSLSKKLPENPIDISTEYKAVADDPLATQAFLMVALRTYYASIANANTAAQITQASSEESVRLQALQVSQNSRIINLLEDISKKLSR